MLKNVFAVCIAFAILFIVPWPITALAVVAGGTYVGAKALLGKFKS